jgi:RimJ/RimL family protein N-acetyltransferase
VEDELEFIRGRQVELKAGTAVQFFIWRRDRFVGSIGTVFINRFHDHAEIGYFVTREVEGTGLAYKAVSALIDRLVDVEGMHRISVRIVSENERSLNLARRLGFTPEGIQREAFKLRGEYRDIGTHSLLAREWK